MVAQAKKSYSNFSNVLRRMQTDYEAPDYTYIFSTGETPYQIAQNVAKYYNNALVCSEAGKECGASYTVKLATLVNNGQGGITTEPFAFPRIVTNDGTYIYLRNIRENCNSFKYQQYDRDEDGWNTDEKIELTDNRCATVIIDINGEKNPNQYGADVHQILVYKDILDPVNSNYGCLKSIFLTGKLKYTNYDSNYKFERK